MAGAVQMQDHIVAPRPFRHRLDRRIADDQIDHDDDAAQVACELGPLFSPRIAMESSSNETIKQSVIAGIGLALISQHTISLELSLRFLTTLPVAGFPLMRSWFVAHRKTLPLLPIQARLRDFLIEQGQSVIDDISREHGALAKLRRTADRSA